MTPRSAKLLEDIRAASEFLLKITKKMTLQEYIDNEIVRAAVERKFEVIGEALTKIKKALIGKSWQKNHPVET